MLRLLWILALLVTQLATAHPDSSPPHPARHGKPATLVQGLGRIHHPVSTTNALAQRFFDQGLAYVYAFNHQEAVRSFSRAALLGPKLAMARWGLALALGPNYNAAEMSAAQARRMSYSCCCRAALTRRKPSPPAPVDGDR